MTLTTADYIFGATATCIAAGCNATTMFDYCEEHEDAYTETCTWSQRSGYNTAPEQCDEDAVSGTDRCSMHSEDLMGDDEDTHDYWD